MNGSPILAQDPRKSTEDVANDENISILDPRRFTPTLHANLVSEILNLRRELDSKHKLVEELETNLQTERNENDSLAKQLSSATKDCKVVKRQMQHFENESLAALEEMASERDKTKDANTDLREKLESTQKKLRSQEEDSTRVHDMWAREKDLWAGEKRTLERKVHISEARLKMLLDEIAIQEASNEDGAQMSEGEDALGDGAVCMESDAASIRSSPQRRPSTRLGRHSRNRSNGSYMSIGRNYRMSTMNGDNGRTNGISLADELIFDEEEEDLGDLELDSDDYPENEMRARRALESRQSMYPDEKAKRILGLSNEHQQSRDCQPVTEVEEEPKKSYDTMQSSATILPRDITLVFPPTRPIYVDTGVQPSPPPSPTLPAMVEASSQTIEPIILTKAHENPAAVAEIEANQRRKRVSVPLAPSPPPLNPARSLMTSSSVQTTEQPLSPPATPKIILPMDPSPLSPVFQPEVVSISTQTEPLEELRDILAAGNRAPPPAPISVPSIAIHAPTSAPSSPKEPILPPGTKTVSTQTTGDLVAPMRSSSMQTEPIRVDQRPVKLPAHLLPSAITSKPGTPEPATTSQSSRQDSHHPGSSDSEPSVKKPAARQDLIALLEKAADKKVENRYPGNNDNGPLSRLHQADILTRPFRTSSLFAGFDGPSSDEEDDGEASDDDYRGYQYSSSMLSSRNAKSGRPVNPPTPVPEDKESTPVPRASEDSVSATTPASKRSSYEKPSRVGKPSRNSIGRQPSIRRSAMIQNGTVAHMRSRSPSLGSLGSSNYIPSNYIPKPPFPVPTRSSSRNKPFSKSEGSQSPTPRHSGSYAGRRPYGMKHQRKDSLRKVRSAAPVSKSRSRSRSPTLPETYSEADTTSIPPLPSDIVSARGFNHRHQTSNATAYTANGSVNSTSTSTSVVDAIASSMIGEFMWKYVRKRKTFGGPDTPADVARAAEEASLANHGVRHKRWVWISPYERAIMWSSKQPTSGSALMGKSGRKRKNLNSHARFNY